MTTKKFSKGDRVTCNGRNSALEGRTGVVRYESGGVYWVTFDDTGEYSQGLYPWWLEPAQEKLSKNK